MKATEILNSKPSIDGQMNDLLFEYVDIIEAMQEYAQDQIQKDRERVKKSFTTGSQEAIDDIPIILD